MNGRGAILAATLLTAASFSPKQFRSDCQAELGTAQHDSVPKVGEHPQKSLGFRFEGGCVSVVAVTTQRAQLLSHVENDPKEAIAPISNRGHQDAGPTNKDFAGASTRNTVLMIATGRLPSTTEERLAAIVETGDDWNLNYGELAKLLNSSDVDVARMAVLATSSIDKVDVQIYLGNLVASLAESASDPSLLIQAFEYIRWYGGKAAADEFVSRLSARGAAASVVQHICELSKADDLPDVECRQ